MKRIYLDTSGLYEYVDDARPHHREVKQTLESFDGHLLTSNFVRDEIITLCLKRGGHFLASRVGKILMAQGSFDVVRITPADEKAAWQLFLERPDKQYSFTDCTSFVLMRRLGIEVALTLDDHFRQEGFEVWPSHDGG